MKTNKLFSSFKRGLDKKRIKKKKPENVYYSPADDMSKPMLYVGLALRTLVLYIGVLGIASFICGAAGLSTAGFWQATEVTPGIIALLSLPVAIAAAIASLGKIPALVTPVAYVGIYMAVIAIVYGNPIEYTVRSALRVYNYALYTVSSIGYYSLGNFMVNDGYDYSTASYAVSDPPRFVGTFLLCTLLGFILYFCVQKKTRILPIVILMTAVIAPILTYNVAKGTTGIAFMLVFICAVLALKVYDHRYGGKADRIAQRRRRREEKKKLRLEARAAKKDEREALNEEADRVFDKAIDADMPLSQAKKARRAVFKAHKNAKKAAKKNATLARKAQKRSDKKARKEKTARLKILKKQLSKASSADKKAEILTLIEKETENRRLDKESKKTAKSEKRTEKKEKAKRSRRISMAGGYAGAGVAVFALVAVLLPMLLVKSNFMVIKPLDDRVQTVRTYVTAYLRGSDVNLNDPYVYGLYALAPRELSFDPLELDDKLLFRVDTIGLSNIYMRSWVATDFDWENNKWVSADYDEVHKYRDDFGKDFTPDSVKTDFYKYVYPSSSIIDDANTYKNFKSNGFAVQQVDVWRVRGSSLLIFVPSHMNTDMGLLEYGEITDAPYKYQNYFEGTYSSFYYRYGRGYSTVSYVTALNRTDAGDNIAESLEYYKLCLDFIREDPDATGDEANALVFDFGQMLYERGIEYKDPSIVERYYLSMTSEERKDFLESAESEDRYAQYVLENYSAKSENEAIALIAADIKAQAIAKELENGGDGVLTHHEAAMAVVEYLRGEEFTYTEEPNGDLTNGKKPVIEAFLTDVKQGYCSHFASSAVYLLREMDVPARYVEGYVAKDFDSLGGTGSKNRSDVYATDAHAWVEIYMDDIGWMQYEVTPGELSEDMYDPNSNTIDPNLESITDPDENESTPPPFGDEPDIDEILSNLDEEEPEEESDLVLFLRIIIIALCVACVASVISLIIRFISKRASRAMEARYAVIDSAKNMDVFTDKSTDNHKTARQLNDWILEIFSLVGCEPRPGELPCDFVARMRDDYGDLSSKDIGDVIDAMQKEEFGHGLNFSELCNLAEYLEDITASVYASMNPWQKLVNRYFKRKI